MNQILLAKETRLANSTKHLLIVDDDSNCQLLLKSFLRNAGYQVDVASSLKEMEAKIRDQFFDAVLLDYYLGEDTGLEGIRSLSKYSPTTQIIIMTGQGSIELAVDAMQSGAAYFLTKSSSPDKILDIIAKILRFNADLSDDRSRSVLSNYSHLVGSSPEFRQVINKIDRFKDIDSTILITGESGTGKEMVARAIHYNSIRKENPFRAINCAAIPENLIESELFGHRRGAFTDAKTDRKGLFEECQNGTLLLDEIGEMPLGLQAKLLRVLQEREITPVGSSTAVKVNTRIIASTNRILKTEVEKGNFRADLFFRLSVLTLKIPPLRKHPADIPLLVNAFIEHFNQKFGRQVRQPSAQLMSRLIACQWPGNVRELRNAIERGMVLSDDDQLHVNDVFQINQEHDTPEFLAAGVNPANLTGQSSESADPNTLAVPMDFTRTPFPKAKMQLERDCIIKVLRDTQGNISKTAKILGLYRAHVYRILQRHAIDPSTYKH